MNKQSLFIPGLLLAGLFSLGVFVGINIVEDDENEALIETTDTNNHPVSESSSEPLVAPLTIPMTVPGYTGTVDDSEYPQLLEDKIADLEARVFELEQAVVSQTEASPKAPHSRADTRLQQMNNLQTTASLIKAGISEEAAADIVRRRNDIELRKLELHDRASREVYLNTPRYRSELSQLIAEETTLREELGDDAYDRYLFANGQPNRVKVISVMMGSAAEQAGMKDGDLIVNYGQLRIFEWRELKGATSEGILGDYVSVDILRNQQLLNLTVPRGPLGVRLGTARITP